MPNPSGPNVYSTWGVFTSAIFGEYVPFMMLLFSLYTICGGIRIEGDLPARPTTNTLFLLVGGLLASFIGTTGAAMLLIRPLLDTNRERKHVVHTVIFFIFIVCNCGGCLLPIGDPPLFLGYLLGVPFLYTFELWKEWLFVNGCLLAIYFLWDRFWFYPRETKADLRSDETRVHRLHFGGLWPNIPLLLAIVFSVAVLNPGKPFPGHRLASLDVLAGDRATAAGGLVACCSATHICGGKTTSTTSRLWKWRRCSSAFSSPCSRPCRFWMSRARNWGSQRRRNSFGRPAGSRRSWITLRPTSCSSPPPRR